MMRTGCAPPRCCGCPPEEELDLAISVIRRIVSHLNKLHAKRDGEKKGFLAGDGCRGALDVLIVAEDLNLRLGGSAASAQRQTDGVDVIEGDRPMQPEWSYATSHANAAA